MHVFVVWGCLGRAWGRGGNALGVNGEGRSRAPVSFLIFALDQRDAKKKVHVFYYIYIVPGRMRF